MTEEEWKRLDQLFDISIEELSLVSRARRDELFKKTEKEQEHPEWYEQPCLCYECKCAGI